MPMHTFPARSAVGLLLALLATPRAPADGTVTGTGTAELRRQPEILRVQIEVLAKGKDLKDALAKLKERCEAARTRLVALGAAREAVTVGEAGVTSEKTDRQRQMEQMIRMRSRQQGGKPLAKPKEAPPVVVGALLKADLPLAGADAEEFLLRATQLQDQIKAAELGGLKGGDEKLSPQEQELAEEMGMMMEAQEGEAKRGDPAFLFVAKVPEAERDKLLAEAFQKARRSAAQLARAAGGELGELNQVVETAAPGADQDVPPGMPTGMPVGRPWEYAMRGRDSTPPNAEGPGEAVGLQPGKVVVRVSVSAQFRLKPGPAR